MSRLQYVIKTYANQPKVVIDTLAVAFNMLGIYEDFSAYIQNVNDPYATYLTGPDLRVSDLLAKYAPRLAQPFQYDFLFPWVAREFARSRKREVSGQQDPAYYFIFRNEAVDRGTAIAQWAEANRVDLTKLDLETAVREAKEWTVQTKIVPGEVIYTFPDGWTVQLLTTREQLTFEGAVMQQCVGEYCERVQEGKSIIYSLRDPRGRPHVTMEYSPKSKRFQQVYGKQNEPPKEEYAVRARYFIREHFNAEPAGMLMAGAHPSTLNLRGADLRGVDMGGMDFSGVDMSSADFSRTFMDGLHMRRADLIDAKFRHANMTSIDLTGANLTRADLSEANLYKAHLGGAVLIDADLTRALLSSADLQRAILKDANLRRTDLTYAHLEDAYFEGANLADADLTGAHMEGTSVSGAYWNAGTVWPAGYEADTYWNDETVGERHNRKVIY
jgi:uncharacterized protein YjbI with pentapeptide repeats